MIFRALDVNKDWTFGKGRANYLINNLAISENIRTRLLSFLNNCFFDMAAGVDWITYLGTPNQQAQLTLRTRAIILLSEGVLNCSEVDINVDRNRRLAFISYTISTVFSTNYQQEIQVVNYV